MLIVELVAVPDSDSMPQGPRPAPNARDEVPAVWSRGVTRWFRFSLSVADSFVRVEESATGCRWSLDVSAVSSFVPV
jgi:hypothetical protein